MTALFSFFSAVLGALLIGVIAESYRRHRDRQGIASSIRGEISAILDLTNRRDYVTSFTRIAADLRANKEIKFPDVIRRPLELDPIYARLAKRVGVLGGDLPERIVSFYSRLMGIRLDLQKLADGVWDKDLNTKAHVIEVDLAVWEETRDIGLKVCGDLANLSKEKWGAPMAGESYQRFRDALILAATIAVASFFFTNSYAPKYGLVYNIMTARIVLTQPCMILNETIPPPPNGYTLDRPLPPLPKGAALINPLPQNKFMCGVSFPYRWILAILVVGLCGMAIWPRRRSA